jgi:putative two-component system hydrogenase maturation factor HypX/HoxX
MDVVLLVSAFNGLTQRVWCALREAGHRVRVQLAVDEEAMARGVAAARPDLVLCPFLKERIPAVVWRHWRTVVIHPGPVGDRGPSSLDHAIMDGVPVWGVTAVQAVEDLDAGPIWATRTFPMPADPPTKSALYNGPVADAAMECIDEVLRKAVDPSFVPTPLASAPRAVPGTGLRPLVRQPDRTFHWEDDAAAIVRRIRAADGFPGVRTTLAGLAVNAYDAAVGRIGGPPGQLIGHRDGAVLVGTGRASVWIGQLKPTPVEGAAAVKLPATVALRGRLRDVPEAPFAAGGLEYAPARYRRRGPVGELRIRAYNGALSTRQCRKISLVLRAALRQDTRVLVIRSGFDSFANGINLNTVEKAADPATEAWANIRAINAICRRICAASRQVVVAAYTANAGAGGAMLGLGADILVARPGVVLNPYYDIGLNGSELHSYSLPLRVGPDVAARLLGDKLPIDANQAHWLGLVDAVGPREPAAFDAWLTEVAAGWTDPVRWRAVMEAKGRSAAKARWPLSYYETMELAEMARDMFDNRSGFAEARKAFVYKHQPTRTPAKLTVG